MVVKVTIPPSTQNKPLTHVVEPWYVRQLDHGLPDSVTGLPKGVDLEHTGLYPSLVQYREGTLVERYLLHYYSFLHYVCNCIC